MPKAIPSLSLNELVETHRDFKRLAPATALHYAKVQKLFSSETGLEYVHELYLTRTKLKIIKWRNVVIDRSSAVTFNNYLGHLRTLINFAIQEELISERINPLVSIEKVKHYKIKKKTVSLCLLKKCVNYLNQDPEPLEAAWFWKTTVKFLYMTGIRRKQIVNIQWKDIDLLNKILSTHSNKSKKEWDIPLTDDLVSELLYLLRMTQQVIKALVIGEDYVFRIALFDPRFKIYDETLQMKPDQITDFYAGTLSNHIGERITPHRLRHTMGTIIANSAEIKDTGGIKSLQVIMGHANVSTTYGYVHPDMGDLRKTQLNLPPLSL